MDAEKKPAENVTEVASPPAMPGVALPARNASPAYNASRSDAGRGRTGPDNSAARWRPILLVLCAVGVVMVIGILALQVREYLFYKAPPGVWPQQGAGGTVSAPAVLPAPVVMTAPLSPVMPTMPSALPSPVATTTAPSETAASVVPVPVVTTTVPSDTTTSAVPAAVPTTSALPEVATSAVPASVTTTVSSETVALSAPVVAVTSAPASVATAP